MEREGGERRALATPRRASLAVRSNMDWEVVIGPPSVAPCVWRGQRWWSEAERGDTQQACHIHYTNTHYTTCYVQNGYECGATVKCLYTER